jgi:hypothetical protein
VTSPAHVYLSYYPHKELISISFLNFPGWYYLGGKILFQPLLVPLEIPKNENSTKVWRFFAIPLCPVIKKRTTFAALFFYIDKNRI